MVFFGGESFFLPPLNLRLAPTAAIGAFFSRVYGAMAGLRATPGPPARAACPQNHFSC
jgi:hypothetical protein